MIKNEITTYKLPLSSPTLQPLPPLTLLNKTKQKNRVTPVEGHRIEPTTKKREEEESGGGGVGTVEDEWSRKQSKSSLC